MVCSPFPRCSGSTDPPGLLSRLAPGGSAPSAGVARATLLGEVSEGAAEGPSDGLTPAHGGAAAAAPRVALADLLAKLDAEPGGLGRRDRAPAGARGGG